MLHSPKRWWSSIGDNKLRRRGGDLLLKRYGIFSPSPRSFNLVMCTTWLKIFMDFTKKGEIRGMQN